MAAAVGSGRFSVQVRSQTGKFLKAIPYYNMQATYFLGDQGMNLQFSTNFRGLGLTFANFYPGKHEVWVFDKLVSTFPIFAGPITQVTANSDGTASIQVSDPLWYISKRLLFAQQAYTGKPEAAMTALLSYTQARHTLSTTAVLGASGTQNISAMFGQGDTPQISDLFQQLENMGDGVDYFFRNDGTNFARRFHIYGGKYKPAKLPLGLIFPGGALKEYSMQLLATGIANYVVVTGSGTGLNNFGIATNAAKVTEYAQQYEEGDSSDENSTATLNSQAATLLKGEQSTLQLPSIVVHSEFFNPFVDFDLGSQFSVNINDDYVQYASTARAVGFQVSFGPHDDLTTVIWTNTLEEVT